MLLENTDSCAYRFFPIKISYVKSLSNVTIPYKTGSEKHKNVGRNASWERFRTNFIHILAYLSQGQDGFPNEMCLFGEVAAFQVLAVQTGHWQAWHENLVLQVLPTSKQTFFCSNLFELKL